ncbi:MAG: NAD(P)-binding protein [Thermoleophilia bacterium]|nr:NAD(P)-binding protein [Thermoleophilia bacterium]
MSRPPNEIPTIWTTGFTDVFNTGTWRAATPVYAWRPSPCLVDCPIDNAIPRWIKYISEGDYQQAWLELVETNPFPAVTGRVCHHPCEGHCNREVLEAVVGINGLEHFLGDHALDHGWALPEAAEPVGKRVAVVGGGPAGLSCAYHLRRLGYQVTIFEARERLGGLLRHGIPEYRLAAQVADREIQRVVDLGVEVRTSTSVGDSQAFAQLREEYDAVFVAVGAQQAKRLPHLDAGAGAGRVLDGLDYLRRCIEGATRGLGERMTVIGGGSAAVDVARTARRLGHRVSMVALETRAVMPAQREEVEEALEEGVALFDGAMVTRVEATAGGLRLDCVKVQLDPTAPAGELRPLPVDGGGFVLEADVIVTAIGQDPNLTAFGGDIRVDAGVAAAAPDTAATTAAGVFAGGDAAGTSRFVSVAIGDGRRAAYGIAAYLGHPDAEVVVRHTLEQAVNRNEVNVFYFDFAERNEKAKAPVAERLTGFAEVNRVFTPEQAAAEAARCLTCGTCIECDNCFVFCPDMAVKKDDSKSDSPEGRYVILDQYCKGCGLCVAECPRGAVHLEQVTQ